MGACGDAPVMLVNNKRMCELHDATRSSTQLAARSCKMNDEPCTIRSTIGPDVDPA